VSANRGHNDPLFVHETNDVFGHFLHSD
jgi:hypothetical protein